MAKKSSKRQRIYRAVKSFLKKITSNDVVVRASKTFTQAFGFTFLAGLAGVNNVDTGLALLIGAGSAGFSAVWNSLRNK